MHRFLIAIVIGALLTLVIEVATAEKTHNHIRRIVRNYQEAHTVKTN